MPVDVSHAEIQASINDHPKMIDGFSQFDMGEPKEVEVPKKQDMPKEIVKVGRQA